MSYTKNKYTIRSPKLNAEIVENILLILSRNELCIDEIFFDIQNIRPLSLTVLKKYLVYLIDFELVTYNGQKRVYFIEEGGFDLLDYIKIEKNSLNNDYEDVTITLEKDIIFPKLNQKNNFV